MISRYLLLLTGNAWIFGTSPFAPADFEAFITVETRRFSGPELSSIEQTGPTKPKP